MKKNIQSILKISALVLTVSAFAFSCSDDDDNNNGLTLTGDKHVYALTSTTDDDISGTATFAERSDGATVVTVDLDGVTAGQSYPVYIRANSALQTGAILIDLTPVSGSTGISQTIIEERNDDTDITYDQLLALNGYLVVNRSAGDATVVSQVDIGSNELTATSKTYTLASVGESDVTGTVKFSKRMNGNTLATVTLNGTTTGTDYMVYVYNGSLTAPGTIAIDLNTVDGATGTTAVSTTNISTLNGGTTGITYDQLNTFNGHIGVLTTGSSTYVASTNIGSNVTP